MGKLLRALLLLGAIVWSGAILASANLPEAWQALCEDTTVTQRWLLVILFLLPSAASQWLDTHGWLVAGGRHRPPGGFGRLFSIRLAGEAVNASTPLLPLGGEPVKAMLLHLGGGPLSGTAAALAAARLAMVVSQVAFVLVGIVVAGIQAPGNAPKLSQFGLFPVLLGVGLVVGIGLGLLLPSVTRRWLTARLNSARFQMVGNLLRGVLEICREQPYAVLQSLAWFFAGWGVVAGEFWIVARVLGHPLSFWQALGMEALMNSICMATFFLPGNLGSQEAGLLWVSELFRSPGPLGPLLVVLRRLRELVWVGAGFLCLAVLGGAHVVLARRSAYSEGQTL